MPIQTMLVPTDFSELSNEAIDFAFLMAQQLKPRMIFLHVLEWPGHPEPMTALYNEGYAFRKDQASAFLNDLVQRAKDEGLEGSQELIDGIPFVEIIRTARKRKADLIVMGTHGRTGLSHVMIGSQAERVVRESPCAVLTVKSAKHKYTPA